MVNGILVGLVLFGLLILFSNMEQTRNAGIVRIIAYLFILGAGGGLIGNLVS